MFVILFLETNIVGENGKVKTDEGKVEKTWR